METLVLKAAQKAHIRHERLFALAFEYNEDFRPRKQILRIYYKWTNGFINNRVVEDYCLDVLAGRATPIEQDKV